MVCPRDPNEKRGRKWKEEGETDRQTDRQRKRESSRWAVLPEVHTGETKKSRVLRKPTSCRNL